MMNVDLGGRVSKSMAEAMTEACPPVYTPPRSPTPPAIPTLTASTSSRATTWPCRTASSSAPTPKLDALLHKLAGEAKESDAAFITLYYGEDVTEEAGRRRQAHVFAEACPDAEVAIVPGGQPVYYYLISIE